MPSDYTPVLLSVYDREQLRALVVEAIRGLCRQSGSDTVYAAVVMREMNALAREARGDKNKEHKLDEFVFGPALFPSLSPDKWKEIDSEKVFQEFADFVSVIPTPTGTKLQWLNYESDHAAMIEERQRARNLLKETMAEMVLETGRPDVACSALKVRLKSKTHFDERKILGYAGFREWLEDCPDIVSYVDFRSGGRIQLAGENLAHSVKLAAVPNSTLPPASYLPNPNEDGIRNGYIIVDSNSIMHDLRELLGRDTDANTVPNWDILMRFCRARWPAEAWKGLYFVYAPKERAETLGGLYNYLSANGFQPIHLYDQNMEGDRRKLIAKIQETLGLLRQQDCHVVLVSHSGSLGNSISEIGSNSARNGKTVVCGLLDFLEQPLLDLCGTTVQCYDLERDIKAFRQALPRHRPIPADQFDPARYL